MSTEKTAFILTQEGIYKTNTSFSSFAKMPVSSKCAVGCLTQDARKPCFWFGDETEKKWSLFDPQFSSIKNGWQTSSGQTLQSAQFDQKTGDAFFLTPFEYINQVQSNAKITKFSPATRHASTFDLTYRGVPISSIFITDMKIDSSRRKIWILDANAGRVIRADVDTGIVDRRYSSPNITHPSSMTIDYSTGNVYIRAFNRVEDENESSSSQSYSPSPLFYETIFTISGEEVTPVVKLIDTGSVNPSTIMMASDSMRFDPFRRNLWWISNINQSMVFLMNMEDLTMTSLVLPVFSTIYALSVDLDSGEAFVCGDNSLQGAVFKISQACTSYEMILHYNSSTIYNIMVLQPEFGSLIPFYVDALGMPFDLFSSSSSVQDSESTGEIRSPIAINNLLFAEPENNSLSSSSYSLSGEDDIENPYQELITEVPDVMIRIWDLKSSGFSGMGVGVAKGASLDTETISNAVFMPVFSWAMQTSSCLPAFVVTTQSGDLIKFVYNKDVVSTNNSSLSTEEQILSMEIICPAPVGQVVYGLSSANGDGNIYVSGNGLLARVNIDLGVAGQEYASSDASASSQSTLEAGPPIVDAGPKIILPSELTNNTTEGGVSVQFHEKSAGIWFISGQDGFLSVCSSLNDWDSRKSIGPFPMPFKAVSSKTHSGVFVACKHGVHFASSDLSTKRLIYAVPEHEVLDIYAKNGDVGIALASNDRTGGLLKVLSGDLITNKMLYNTTNSYPTKICLLPTGNVILAVERIVDNVSKTKFVSVDKNGILDQTTNEFNGAISSLWLDENFGFVFATLSNGTVINVGVFENGTLTLAATSLGVVSGGIKMASGSLVVGLTKSTETQSGINSTTTLPYQTKIRIFVGSTEGASDRWDSGEITTTKKAIVYGGGNNLVPGECYWVGISLMDNEGVWSEPYSKWFVVPVM